jgi:hypothetical protein
MRARPSPRGRSGSACRLRLDASADPSAGYPGCRSGASRRVPVGLAHTFTEVEFAVRGTVDADWLATYEFRLADSGATLGGPSATIALQTKPAVQLSPGQQRGIAVKPVAQGPRYPLAFTAFAATPTAVPACMLLGPTAVLDSPHTNFTLADRRLRGVPPITAQSALLSGNRPRIGDPLLPLP